ncbi:cupin domain-containing protein [Streptomyces sp. B1866]|uniref:cupin domain-containing protein n=1 Tax=Streptomyces sp. B1866 TaxID=3075431 RepID=UPI00288F6522|nr:cupin domain-containing protein [Streptomyces sp. B1866]MDT3396478.1 cupin domain-containing protein [Streptomyces sp. B1866]
MRHALRAGSLAGSVLAVICLAPGPAAATPPGPGVTGRVILKTTVGNTDHILRELTIPPGQSTGWHYHDGPIEGVVLRGTLTHFASTCASDGTYRSGDVIREPSGPGYVHIGRNLGRTPLVLLAHYTLPHDAPLSEDAPNPGCDFQ